MRKPLNVLALLLAIFLLAAAPASARDLIDVPFCEQEMTNWCWAGSSWSILHHYGETPTQCEIVNFGLYRSDCCGKPSVCNKPNYMCGTNAGQRGITQIMTNWNTPNSCVGGLTKAQFKTEVDNCHPFVIFWESSTVGHFIVGDGISEDQTIVYVMDPWPGKGKMSGTWEWVNRPDGTLYWGSTLKTNRQGACAPPDPEDDVLKQCAPVSVPEVAAGTWQYYTFELPADAQNVTVKMTGGTGDADLYVLFGQKPDERTYDCRPYESDSTEQCDIGSPRAGTYYVGVHAYRPFTGVTLEACWEGGSSPGKDIIVDDADSAKVASTGTWQPSSATGFYGVGSKYADANMGAFTFKPQVADTGQYDVFLHWTYHANRSANVPIEIIHAGGTDTVYVNMQNSALGGQWNRLGSYSFNGQSIAQIVIKTTNGQACADAVKLTKIR